MAVALRTLATHGGGTLVVSGYQGEAERLALLAPQHPVVVEPTARTTWDNVELSIPYFEQAHQLAIASDWFHARRASGTYGSCVPISAHVSFPPNGSGGVGAGFKRLGQLTRLSSDRGVW
jgi:hypothetical protein